MKLQTRPTRTHILTAAVVVLTFCFLLTLSQGFVTSGDDWFFTSRTMDENLWEALQKGWANAIGHYRGTNGRLLGNGFSKTLGCSEFWREIVRCGIILTILLQICRMAKVRSLTLYAAALMLTVALPADLYAQAYAWAAGFFNYVPPLVVIFGFLFRVDRLQEDGRDSVLLGVGMLLMAFAGQLFVENVTVGICLLSAGVFLWYLLTHKKLSWSLSGHLLGSIIGCAVMLMAPGYDNVNQEGYRQVSATFEELLKVVKANFPVITQYLTENNWLVIAPLTALSIYLLLSSQTKKRGLRVAALAALMVCPVYFYAHSEILTTLSYAEWVAELSFWLDIAANLCYLLAVLAAVLMGIQDPGRKRRAVLCICAVPLIFGPLVVVTPIGPRCLYIPYMLLVCLLMILLADAAERCDVRKIKALRIPALAMVACVLALYLWTAVWNGRCEQIRTTQIENAMASGASSVELPSFPYAAFVHNGNGSVMKYYYYYETPGDLEFTFLLPSDWYQR